MDWWTGADILSGETMSISHAVSAQGVGVGFREKGSDDPYTFFREVKTTPEVGESAEKIDVTPLDADIKQYIRDIPDYSSDLEFSMNAMPLGVEESNLEIIQGMSKNATYDWVIYYPRNKIKVQFYGEWTWRMGAGAVSSPMELFLAVIPKSSPAWSEIKSEFDVTYDPNGGEGTMTDSNSPYAIGSDADVMECTFTNAGKTFSHWSTSPDNAGVEYSPGEKLQVFEDVTLYAIWSE